MQLGELAAQVLLADEGAELAGFGGCQGECHGGGSGMTRLKAAIALASFVGCGEPSVTDPSSVSVMLGNGDGSLHLGFEAAAGVPNALAVGDIDRNGLPDMIVANLRGVGLFLAREPGQYAPMNAIITIPSNDLEGASTVAVGDLNEDGNLDIVVGSYRGNVVLLFGHGEGTFQQRDAGNLAAGTYSLVLTDFNSDRHADLAIADYVTSRVHVLLGAGDGTLGAPLDTATGDIPLAVGFGDFNMDGKEDLVTANADEGLDRTISLLIGNGDGTFQSWRGFSKGGALTVSAADLNEDGTLDLAIGGFGSTVFIGDGSGGFDQDLSFQFHRERSFSTCDLNGDNVTDLVAVNMSNGVGVLLGTAGTFTLKGFYNSGEKPTATACQDVNGDGYRDVAVINSGGA